ncbi:hypothetical protein A2Z10_01035 [Candidatus Azambacteria bacterium RBG_16_47_10]|uniref:EamA domain-containing protein n=1 Tax=Candidatus Azambacteria bacterium RBG_16_47_10 TaxID=1797292 RepID=A0A1F5AZ97_9BACT|nr:MAG: hypothetical protein A2Z10_01035 [Candidatus Azambacteria bacterium RBG_16_47_10]
MQSWVIFALLSAVSAAFVAIFGKIGLAGVDTTVATTVRAAVMATFLVIMTASLGKAGLVASLPSKAIMFIVLSGIAGAVSWLFYFFALRHGPAAGVVALDRLSVVFVLVLAALFLGEGITWKTGVGAALVTVGAIFMSIR